MNIAHPLKWSFFSELISKSIQPVIFIVLARLLTPEDFGVITAALMIIGFSQIFWEAGMGKALIQRQTNVEEASNVAFWINIVTGCIVAVILYLVSSAIACTFFHDERVTVVLKVMTIQVLLGATSSVHIALLQKNMEFKKLFWVRFATVSLPGIASIPLAWNGMGYWALVAGSLVGQTVQVFTLWHMSYWRPKWSFNTRVARHMCRFGAWVGFSSLFSWFYTWADSLIVGMYLGSVELGLYRTGNQFAIMIFALFFTPITPVLYTLLSRMNRDKYRLGRAIEKVINWLTLLSIPIAFMVFFFSEPISSVFFGDKWLGISLVIGVLTLMHGFAWIVGMNGEVYCAMGRPSLEIITTAPAFLIYLGGYLLSIQQGFEIFIWTRLFLTLGGVLLHLFVLQKLLPIDTKLILYNILMMSVYCIVVNVIVRKVVNYFITNVWWQLIAGSSLIIFIIGASTIFLLERNGLLKEMKVNMVKNSG